MQIFFFLYIIGLALFLVYRQDKHLKFMSHRDREFKEALWWSSHYKEKNRMYLSKLKDLEQHYGIKGRD